MSKIKLVKSRCILCESQCSRFEYSFKLYDFYRCVDCGLVYVYPTPSREELKKIYQEENFYSEGFIRKGGAEIYRRLKAIGKYYKPGFLLDIGCAAGYFLSAARFAGWSTLGIEISKHTADYASNKLNLEIINQPLEDTNLPEESFDVITLWGVIEHVTDPVGFMKQIVKLLKGDGMACIATNNVDGWMGRLMREKFPFITYPEHLWLFNIRTIKMLMRLCGLKVVRIDTNDVITPDKAVRGLSKMLFGKSNPRTPRAINILSTVITRIFQPLVWVLGRLNLGSEVEIYAKRI